ncbi:MAG: extracellular solute-binding protein [Acidiferrobacterales bacterium]|nr:extracellular solute-binding protein [Acidiferrobacterales bacterium]
MKVFRNLSRICLLSLCASGISLSAHAHEDVTFVSWTGPYMRAQMLGFVRPYEQMTGKSVAVEHYAGGLKEVRNQVESANVIWDVIDMTEADVLRGCAEGLLEPLTDINLPDGIDGVPASEDFVEGALNECGIGGIRWSSSFAYDTRVFGDDAPTTVADFFDVERFPGPRAARRDPSVLMEWALMADGVPLEDIYATLETDEGLERAFKMLDRIRSGLLWWAYENEPIRYLEDGLVTMSGIWTVSATDRIRQQNSPIAIVTDGAITEMDLYAVPKGTQNLEAAFEFIRYASSSDALAGQAMHQPIEPTRLSAYDLIPDEIKSGFVTGPNAKSGFTLASDARWWAENYVRISEKFEEWAMKAPRQGAIGGVR